MEKVLGDWHKISAANLCRAFRAKEVSPVDVLDEVLRQAERINPQVNAIVALDEVAARAAAKASEKRLLADMPLGRLDGIPLTVKDNLFVQGMPATWGSPIYSKHRPPSDELPIARARERGGVIFGKTNVPQFTLQGFTSNQLFGTTRNPWNLALTTGGSSGGAVAAVACGFGPVALGTDGGGSMRRPAGYTNLVGLKPSIGRVARAGGFPEILYDLEVIGLVARTVDDVRLLYEELAGPDPRDRRSLSLAHAASKVRQERGTRRRVLLVLRFGNSPVDAEIVRSVTMSARRLEQLGHHIDEGDAPFSIDTTSQILDTVFSTGLACLLQEKQPVPQLDESLAVMLERGRRMSGVEYLVSLTRLWDLRNRSDSTFGDYDFLMTPTSAAMPWEASRAYPDRISDCEVGPRGHAMYTGFVNILGIPAIALPAPRSAAGMPVGFQLVGRFGDETSLLEIAREYEAAWPWAEDWPSVTGG